MLYRTYTPLPPLSNFVERFWLYEGHALEQVKERILPTGALGLVINLREDVLRIYDREDHNRFHQYCGSLIIGACSEFYVISTPQQSSLIGVHFKPGGAFPFLKLPADKLLDTHVSLDDLWGTAADDLRDQLLEAKVPEARFSTLEQALLARAYRPLERHPAVVFALDHFQDVPHTHAISDVTSQIGLSQTRFVQIFREEVGLTPKLFSRIQRFQQALRNIEGRRREQPLTRCRLIARGARGKLSVDVDKAGG